MTQLNLDNSKLIKRSSKRFLVWEQTEMILHWCICGFVGTRDEEKNKLHKTEITKYLQDQDTKYKNGGGQGSSMKLATPNLQKVLSSNPHLRLLI